MYAKKLTIDQLKDHVQQEAPIKKHNVNVVFFKIFTKTDLNDHRLA